MVNAVALATRLGNRFGLAFEGSLEQVQGGLFAVVRPVDLAKPNGFGVVVSRSARRVEAVLRFDDFVGSLLRHLSEADDACRSTYAGQVIAAGRDEIEVVASVNGEVLEDPAALPEGNWRQFEIECSKRIGINGPSARSNDIDQHLLAVSGACMGMALALLPLEEVGGTETLFEGGLPEGARSTVVVNRYERNPSNRAACISHHGFRCNVCDFDFRTVYGEVGEAFIEVHHRVPVSQMGGAYRIDPIRDLVPVCSNCHAMVHRTNPPIPVEGLRKTVLCLRSTGQRSHSESGADDPLR